MRIEIDGTRSVHVLLEVVDGKEYTDRDGITTILFEWADRPSRSWFPAEDDENLFIIGRGDTRGGIHLYSIAPGTHTGEFYDLRRLAAHLNSPLESGSDPWRSIVWGQRIGDPTPIQQVSLDEGFRRYYKGLPTSIDALRQFVYKVVGESL